VARGKDLVPKSDRAGLLAQLRKDIPAPYAKDRSAERFVSFLEEKGLELMDGLAAYKKELAKPQERKLKSGKSKTYRLAARTRNHYIDAAVNRIRYALEHAEAELTVAQKLEIERALKRNGKRAKIASIAVPEDRILSYAEIRKLIASIPDPDVALLVEFLSMTGCRISEALGLLLADVRKTNSHYECRIAGKGDKERKRGITADLYDRIRARFNGPDGLFQRDGRTPRREAVSMRIKHYGREILDKDISAHTLRHSWATHALKKTGRIKAVQEALGHSNPSTTLGLYVHDRFTWEEEKDLFNE